jgi:SAM-dependent methyltransferase
MKLYHQLAEYYYAIEDKHRDIADDILLIRNLLKGKQNPTLLDLGCGTGEHMEQLQQLGFNCTGIDKSRDMLRIAQMRFPHSGNYLEGDIASFDFFEDFDIIISLFGTFNYIIEDEDIVRALWNTWKAMKPGGIGLFEVWNAIPIRKIQEKTLGHISTTKFEGVIIDRERGFSLIDGNKTIVKVNYRYTVSSDGFEETVLDKHVMRAFEREEIEGFIRESGFSIKNVYANALREPYRETSNRMILHFVKE